MFRLAQHNSSKASDGAIDFFGPKLGLPPAISGHQNYFLWGPRDWNGKVILVLDTNDEDERKLLDSVEDLGQVVSSPWAMAYERRNHIYLCRDLKMSVRELWTRVKKWLGTRASSVSQLC